MRRIHFCCSTAVVSILFSGLFSGCSHAPSPRIEDARSNSVEVLNAFCTPSDPAAKFQGTIRMKITAQDKKGEFPADFRVTPDELYLEVTNLIGGTEAKIKISRAKYRVEIPSQKKPLEGVENWNGIPLRWGIDLFMGKTPCPKTPTMATWMENGSLSVEDGSGDQFIYRLNAAKQVETLDWTPFEQPKNHVLFTFKDPKNWEMKSEQGFVKVRIKERKKF